MWPDTRAVGGVTHHHIIESPLWDLRQVFSQCRYLIKPVIHTLHQKRPWAFPLKVVLVKGPKLLLPDAAALPHQAAFSTTFHRKAG